MKTNLLSLPIGGLGTFDAQRIMNYQIPLLVNGTWYLFYNGVNAGNQFTVGLATSKDGISFTKIQTGPVLNLGAGGTPDALGLFNPSFVFTDNTWFVFYAGLGAGAVWTLMVGTGKEPQSLTKSPLVTGGNGPVTAQVIPLPISNTPTLYEARDKVIRVFYTRVSGGNTYQYAAELSPNTFVRL
jgi:hypothetical protein